MNQTIFPSPAQYIGRPLVSASVPTCADVAIRHSAAFVAFLLLNFVLFVRPTELIPDPDIYGVELYQYVMVLCLVLGFPAILEQLRADVLERRPITLCVFGFTAAIVLSHLSRFAVAPAVDNFIAYLKVVLYFLLFNGLVTTTARLRAVLNVILWSIVIIAGASVLQFHDVNTLPTIDVMIDSLDKQPEVLRLRGAGMFRDPNDFCVLVAIAVPLALSHLLDRTRGGLRVLWLVPLAVLVDAVLLTQSRGGFLAMLVGIAVVMAMRFGRVVGIALMLLVPGMLLALGGGRQTSFSTGSGTAQERVQVWSDALVRLRGNPVFGVGVHEFLKESRLVVHNTYLHAYAETGLIGGTIFIGACFLTARHFYRRRNLAIVRNPEMRRLVPYLAGTCGCFCMGMMSLSLTYLTLTVMIFAIGDVTGRLATTDPEIPEDRADLRLGGQLVGASIAFLIFMNVFVRVAMVRG